MRKFAGFSPVVACVLMLLPVQAAASAPHPDPLHEERLEIGRALLEVQSTNWPSVLPYYSENIEYHDPIVDVHGIDAMSEFLGRLFAATPDLVTTIEDETLQGDVYSATWTMVGQFSGVPYSAKGISIIKFGRRSTRVYYQRDYYSENDIMLSIPGLDQAAIGFRTFYRCAVDPTFECPLKDDGGAADAPLSLSAAPATTLNGTSDLHGTSEAARESRELRREQLRAGRAVIEINGSNWPSLLRFYTEDIEYHDPIVDIYGIDTMGEFLGRLFASSPDLITTVEDETLVDGVYMATWTMAGQFDGIPFSAPGMSIVKFRPGTRQVYFARDYYTEGDIMANIPGLDLAIAGFRDFYRCAVDPSYECAPGGAVARSDSQTADRSLAGAPTADARFTLQQNAPNPFRPATSISFVVPAGGADVSLRIYDVTGREIRTLVDGFEPSGVRSVGWNGTDDRGRRVAAGAYFYRLTGPSFSEIRKMVLLK
ncbi:MAG: SnoaL-like domain-containing protein [Gemmatimonadetes bacterium]|nr:SnoaL-like domain-containing protein [Gemmatimonadota bacterium]